MAACADALWERRRGRPVEPERLEAPINGCCTYHRARAHLSSRAHCRALVARAVAGEPVPADVREVMREYMRPGVTRNLRAPDGEFSTDVLPVRAAVVVAHAVAPGAEKMRGGGDSWLLRLDTAEGTRWGVIVELPKIPRADVGTCMRCGHTTAPVTDWICSCGGTLQLIDSIPAAKPVHLREQHATLADACKVLLRTGPTQAARAVRAWLRDPPCDLALLHDGLAVLARRAGVPALEVAVDAVLAGEARERVIDVMEAA